MKKISILFIFMVSVLSCSKKSDSTIETKSDSTKIIESINIARTKINDSIKIRNEQNIFRDLSGSHKFTHNGIENTGSVNFTKIGRDLYKISGGAKSVKNYVKIEGEIKMVSEEFLNFDGEIIQSIQENNNGKIDVRNRKTSFAKKGKDKFWRLQNMRNSSGFIDYIDIY